MYRKKTYHLGTLTCAGTNCAKVVPRKTANQRFCKPSCKSDNFCKTCDGILPTGAARHRSFWYCNDDCKPTKGERIKNNQHDYIPPTRVYYNFVASEEQTWDRISHWCAVYHENIPDTLPGHTPRARNNKLAWYITYCQFAEEVTEEDEIVARSLFRV